MRYAVTTSVRGVQTRPQLGEGAGGLVARTHTDSRQRPIDPEFGIVPPDSEVFGRVVAAVDAIADVCHLAEHLKTMQETGWHVEMGEGFVVQPDTQLIAERGRIDTDVHEHVEDRAAGAAHQFAFAGAGATVHRSDDACSGTRLGVLDERGRIEPVVLADICIERSGEEAA